MNNPTSSTRIRPIEQIARELEAAEAFASETTGVPSSSVLVAFALEQNDLELDALRRELAEARSSNVELSIEGTPVTEYQISVSYLNRVTGSLQAVYKAIARTLTTTGQLAGQQGTLRLASTAPGSFKMMFRTAEDDDLNLFEKPLSDRALGELFELLEAGRAGQHAVAAQWASTSDESAVRAMIRLGAALAASRGTTQLRWTSLDGHDRTLALSADNARRLASTLAGQAGQEIVEVRGRLRMAQEDPPRVRIRTETDEHLASVGDDDLLDEVRGLLFTDVVAEIAIEMSTSPTTGAPTTTSHLLHIRGIDRVGGPATDESSSPNPADR